MPFRDPEGLFEACEKEWCKRIANVWWNEHGDGISRCARVKVTPAVRCFGHLSADDGCGSSGFQTLSQVVVYRYDTFEGDKQAHRDSCSLLSDCLLGVSALRSTDPVRIAFVFST